MSNWDTRNVEDMSSFLYGNVNLQSLTLGPNMVFKDYYDIFLDELYDSLFFTTRWKGLNSNYIFDDINTLLNDYDGNYPDTYIREKSKISETVLDSDGWKILPSGEWIYVQDSAAVTRFKNINDKRYFFSKIGIMQTGWQYVSYGFGADGYTELHYFNSSGEMQFGWQYLTDLNGDTSWFYFDTYGELPHQGWVNIENQWYYFVNIPSHVMQGTKMETGWLRLDNQWYYLGTDGSRRIEWQKIDGYWYYFNNSAEMQTGWLELNGQWYYLNNAGDMSNGWKKIDGYWYYFDINGVMEKGWKLIDSHWYFFSEDGLMETGWLQLDKKWYYLDSSGIMQIGNIQIDGILYKFDASGVMQ